MNLKILCKNLLYLRKNGKNISNSSYPSDITLSSEITSTIKDISKFTNSKGFFTPTQGSTGWEYAINLFYLVDELYISKPVSGNYTSVSPQTKISINQEVSKDNSKLKFILNFGEKVIKTKEYLVSDLQKELLYGLVASFHTHPKTINPDGTEQHTFFSPQDIASLLGGPFYILGLIAKDTIWLACKTNNSSFPNGQDLFAVSRAEREGIQGMKGKIKSSLNANEIVFYQGSVGGSLKRV